MSFSMLHYTSGLLGDLQKKNKNKKKCQHILHLTSCMYILDNNMGMLIYNPTKMVTVSLNTTHKV